MIDEGFDKEDLEGQGGDYSDTNEGNKIRAKGRKSFLGRLVKYFFIAVMVFINLFVLLILVGVISFFAMGQQHAYTEKVVLPGPEGNKIAIINVHGVIGWEMSDDVRAQIDRARQDRNVKGLIVRVNSPGGMVSSSDQIYHAIKKYRAEVNEPVVAFMQGVAASGGYYVSAGCDRIVAEPTTITGSIGVIMGYFVFQGLLEEKLGIEPVIIKSGEKKDWPSSFRPVSDEQKDYIQEKIIQPSYLRFVQIVEEGREELGIEAVRRLADGSIYPASEALREKLIDEIGYLELAVLRAMELAGVDEAKVVEYERPFSFSDFLHSEMSSRLKLSKALLYEFSTPQVMYLWRAF